MENPRLQARVFCLESVSFRKSMMYSCESMFIVRLFSLMYDYIQQVEVSE